MYGVFHMRSLSLNEEGVIRPRLGPIEPNFMQMRLQSPCFMDLRQKHVPWTKLAKRHTKNFDKRRKNWLHSYLLLFILCQGLYNVIIVSLTTNREKLNYGKFGNSNNDIIATIYLSQQMKDPLWNATSFFFFFFFHFLRENLVTWNIVL